MNAILQPAVALMARMRFGAKFALISAIFAVTAPRKAAGTEGEWAEFWTGGWGRAGALVQ